MNPVLTIDPEFESRCPPLTEDELAQLEENILDEGLVLMPLIVWNNTIVDGHNRYKISQAYPSITFHTHEKHFNNRASSISWSCITTNMTATASFTVSAAMTQISSMWRARRKRSCAV